MKILVAGKTGQVATALNERGQSSHHSVITLGRPEMDITQMDSVKKLIDKHAPDLVINAAAYTAVDAAESDVENAYLVNETGALNLACVSAEREIPLFHLSTDYVFDGSKSVRYTETDPVAPIGVYGKSKLAGENAVKSECPAHYVFRTAWVFSPFGNNFVKTMLRLAATRDEISVVDDQIGSPSFAIDIADALLQAASRIETKNFPADPGVYHLAGSGIASWADLAELAVDRVTQGGPRRVRINRIESADYPTPTARPMNSRLDCGKFAMVFDHQLPHWRDSVLQCVDRLISGN